MGHSRAFGEMGFVHAVTGHKVNGPIVDGVLDLLGCVEGDVGCRTEINVNQVNIEDYLLRRI